MDWANLKRDWQPADTEMRSGSCGIRFRFLTLGGKPQGVRGVHVLVKERPKPDPPGVFRSGIRADTILYATQPMIEEPYPSFGYLGQDRNRCRYGVSDENGVVLIEGLPPMPVIVEVLAPTANITEQGSTWNLMMETDEGIKIADRGDPNSVATDEAPALAEVRPESIVAYPTMYVRPHMSANVNDWDAVDKDAFVLEWTSPHAEDIDYYVFKLTLSAPSQHPYLAASSPVVVTETVKVKNPTRPLGERGVGDIQLAPGNIYVIEIDAVRDKDVVASLPRRRVWVPWDHRESDPPLHGNGSNGPAFYDSIWLRTNVNGSSLEERLPVLIRDSPKMFETEYNRLGMAWLDLHKSKANAVQDLQQLVDELPPGNVVRSTAQSLLDANEAGDPIPKRLKFVAPQPTNHSR